MFERADARGLRDERPDGFVALQRLFGTRSPTAGSSTRGRREPDRPAPMIATSAASGRPAFPEVSEGARSPWA